MKVLFVSLSILILLLTMSCNDIIDSDKNIEVTNLVYSKVLGNQENDVLLPLRTGNKWFYKVTNYDILGSISSICYDSIYVEAEILENTEEWYIVSNPTMWQGKTIKMTNTDIGLLMKVQDDLWKYNPIYLVGSYPPKVNPFYAGMTIYLSVTFDSVSAVNVDTVYFKTKYEYVNGYSVNNVNYDCIKYTTWEKYFSTQKESEPKRIQYYVPNTGLVRCEFYNNYMFRSYDYIGKSINYPVDLQQNVSSYYAGILKSGEKNSILIKDVFENKSNDNVDMLSASFLKAENCTANFEYNKFPLHRNEKLNLIANITPKKPGNFNIKVNIGTNKGIYDLIINGTAQ